MCSAKYIMFMLSPDSDTTLPSSTQVLHRQGNCAPANHAVTHFLGRQSQAVNDGDTLPRVVKSHFLEKQNEDGERKRLVRVIKLISVIVRPRTVFSLLLWLFQKDSLNFPSWSKKRFYKCQLFCSNNEAILGITIHFLSKQNPNLSVTWAESMVSKKRAPAECSEAFILAVFPPSLL